MSTLILDASIAAAWLLVDESTAPTDAVLGHLAEDGALVPQLWHLENRHVLLAAERRGRISAVETLEFLDALRDLPTRTDTTPDLAIACALARAHGLSFYNALNLELAHRRDGTLATLDSAFARAAAAVDLSLSPQ